MLLATCWERCPLRPHHRRLRRCRSRPRRCCWRVGLGLLIFVRQRARVSLVGATALLAAIGAAQAREQVEPNAGSWKTWVITSGRDFRTPPPPNGADVTGEIAQLHALAKQRDPAATDLIAY